MEEIMLCPHMQRLEHLVELEEVFKVSTVLPLKIN
jgi:hypothetical protein